MPVVRVDAEVWSWLKTHATPFEDTPNSVLRRLAGLDVAQKSGPVVETRPRAHLNDTLSEAANRLLRSRRHYVVTKGRDRFKHWWFQIYDKKLNQKARRGDFSVVVACDHGSASQVVFELPYSYLRDKVLPKAKLEPDKRYMFEVKKDSYEFVFHPSIRFDGRTFLVKP